MQRNSLLCGSYSACADDLVWVFGYGSLMWRPGFQYEIARHARILGFHRDFCVYSVFHRGSLARPGLVLGLDRGGTCDGVAFGVERRHAASTLAYLRGREQVTSVYRETRVPLSFADGQPPGTEAVAFIVERAHPSYAGFLPLATQARLIRGAHGQSGTNLDYLVSTRDHLAALGLREPRIERLATLTGSFFGNAPSPERRAARIAAMLNGRETASAPVPRIPRDQLRRFHFRTAIAGPQADGLAQSACELSPSSPDPASEAAPPLS